MATIEIRHPHRTNTTDACARTKRLLTDFAAEKSDLIKLIDWIDERRAKARGTGFNGEFNVTDSEVQVDIDLALLLRPFKAKVSQRLSDMLVREFGPA